MLENIELGLFAGAVALYVAAWAWHLAGWKRTSTAQTGVAVRVLWVGWVLHVGMVGLRWYRADHVPMLSAFEFVTFFAMLVIG
jgi:ABC-type transport system involved in cytochrome c biogenesis permease subunit